MAKTGFRKMLQRLGTPAEELDEERLREFCDSHPGVVPIGAAEARREMTVVGEITTLRIVPKAGGSPWLEATISDGDDRMVLMWSGRRSIPGISPGRRLVVSGRPSATGPGNRLVLLNPSYELL